MTTDASSCAMEAVHRGEQEDQFIDLDLLNQCLLVLISG
jgi:hypothetical protein